ncbi:Hypothetical protein NTJ_07199 [Nesidiocoris tenuis]|uniref:Myb-like domain-containing protein n=1 Tax=Nesidiocoris tenuis TaxID=355587 RepID=A0ABN7AQB8_9HEMI|nr:Hypothetical protein NTJ_07199 [Nesidiocoris tenuis]
MLNDEFVDPLASDSEQRSSGIDSASPAKKARVSFAMEEELTLLRLVLKHNPFADQSRWPKILDSLHASSDDKTKVHSMRSIKDKVRLLSREFKASANKIQTRRFGTNEQYSERRSLIADVVQLQDKYMKKIPPEHNKASRPKKINGYPLPDRTMSATVLTGINTESDGEAETTVSPEVSAPNISCETISEQDRESPEAKTDLEVKKLRIQEKTLDLRRTELQTVLKQQELLAKQQQILERTTVIFMKFLDKMTNC